MGQPITWRNVTGPSPAEASQALQAAQQSFGASFEGLNNVVRGTEAFNANQILRVDEAAKQAYLDRLSQARTPEELQALQASGELSRMERGLSVAARAGVRGADEARQTGLRQQEVANFAYKADQRARAEAPERDEFGRLLAQGNTDGAVAFLDMSGLVNKAPLYNAVETTRRARLLQGREDEAAKFAAGQRVRTVTQQVIGDTEQARLAAEAERQRGLEGTVAGFVGNYQQTSQALREGIESGATNFPKAAMLPRNSDGKVAVEKLVGTPLYSEFNAHLNTLGLPTLDTLGGDTAAAENLRSALRSAGAKPTDMTRLEPVIATALSTTAPAPIGREADNAARNIRGLQAEEAAINDQFGTVTNQGQSATLMKAGKEVIAELTNAMTGGRERYNTALSKWLGKGGIQIKDKATGKVIERVLPSEEQLRRVMGQIQTGLIRNTESDVSGVLDRWAESAEAQEGAQQVIRIRDRNRLMGIDPIGKK